MGKSEKKFTEQLKANCEALSANFDALWCKRDPDSPDQKAVLDEFQMLVTMPLIENFGGSVPDLSKTPITDDQGGWTEVLATKQLDHLQRIDEYGPRASDDPNPIEEDDGKREDSKEKDTEGDDIEGEEHPEREDGGPPSDGSDGWWHYLYLFRDQLYSFLKWFWEGIKYCWRKICEAAESAKKIVIDSINQLVSFFASLFGGKSKEC